MKTEMAMGMVILAALAVEGRSFDRAELNAMLDRLAAAPTPKVAREATAKSAKCAPPQPVPCSQACPTCGTVTRYVSGRMPTELPRLRDGAAQLKEMGLDIRLDETALCRACAPGAKVPCAGRIAKTFDAFEEGDEVIVLRADDFGTWVTPKTRRLWIAAEAVDAATSTIMPQTACARLRPNAEGRGAAYFSQGEKIALLPRLDGDPAGWLRVDPVHSDIWSEGVHAGSGFLRDLTYGDVAYDNRLDQLEWVIGGTRTKARVDDVELLKAFLTGQRVLDFGRKGQVPLKRRLDRLRELLGS